MPSKAIHLTEDQLYEVEFILATTTLPQARKQASIISLLNVGYSVEYLAEEMSLSEDTIRRVVRRYKARGIGGFGDPL